MAINVKVSGGPTIHAVVPTGVSQRVSATTVFQGASNSDATAQAAFVQANAAFIQANSSYTLANTLAQTIDAGTF